VRADASLKAKPAAAIINATPSLRDVHRALFAWLDALTCSKLALWHNDDAGDPIDVTLDVAAIHFDGALPVAKRAEREERLRARIAQLVACKRSFPGSLESAVAEFSEAGETEVSLDDLNCRRVASSRGKMPFPPWIASAAFEALQDSKWAEVTHKVPGEADPFCAGSGLQISSGCEDGDRVLVFSSDSDFLAYDLGVHSEVVLFRDMEFSIGGIRMETYPLDRIMKRLMAQRFDSGTTCSPSTIAYLVSRDVHISDRNMIEKAKELERNAGHVAAYNRFLDGHRSALWDDTTQSDHTKAVEMLDTTLSELFHFACTPPRAHSHNEHVVYLPLLHEDATRASPWQLYHPIRQLAYSLLLYKISLASTMVFEIPRRGTSLGRTVTHLQSDPEKLTELAQATQYTIIDAANSLGLPVDKLKLRHLALYQLCSSLAAESKTLPVRQGIRKLLTSNRYASWAYVHYMAQMQAIMYSYRMLLQATDVFLARSGKDESLPRLLEICSTVKSSLASLGCNRLGNVFDAKAAVEDAPELGLVESAICDCFGIHNAPDPNHSKTKTKRRAEASSSVPSPKKQPKSFNPYDILAED
jgi:XPG domain containing